MSQILIVIWNTSVQYTMFLKKNALSAISKLLLVNKQIPNIKVSKSFSDTLKPWWHWNGNQENNSWGNTLQVAGERVDLATFKHFIAKCNHKQTFIWICMKKLYEIKSLSCNLWNSGSECYKLHSLYGVVICASGVAMDPSGPLHIN